jgi:hypothetical protein
MGVELSRYQYMYISIISSARSVDPLRKLQATPRSAAPPGRYVAFLAAFEPLQRRSAGFHRPDIVESFKCT